MNPADVLGLLRWFLVVAVLVLGLIGSFMLQSAWWEAHPSSCMPEVEIIIEPGNAISPNCLHIRHYFLFDLAVASLLAFLAWRVSRPAGSAV